MSCCRFAKSAASIDGAISVFFIYFKFISALLILKIVNVIFVEFISATLILNFIKLFFFKYKCKLYLENLKHCNKFSINNLLENLKQVKIKKQNFEPESLDELSAAKLEQKRINRYSVSLKNKTPDTRAKRTDRKFCFLKKQNSGNQPEFQSSIKKQTVNQTVVYFKKISNSIIKVKKLFILELKQLFILNKFLIFYFLKYALICELLFL